MKIIDGKVTNRGYERARDRTVNLLIRSQAPCHWATRPTWTIFGKTINIALLRAQ